MGLTKRGSVEGMSSVAMVLGRLMSVTSRITGLVPSLNHTIARFRELRAEAANCGAGWTAPQLGTGLAGGDGLAVGVRSLEAVDGGVARGLIGLEAEAEGEGL